MDQFIILNGIDLQFNDHRYRSFKGSTYNEVELHAWASKIFKINKEAPLNEIAAAIEDGGWKIYKYISPNI